MAFSEERQACSIFNCKYFQESTTQTVASSINFDDLSQSTTCTNAGAKCELRRRDNIHSHKIDVTTLPSTTLIHETKNSETERCVSTRETTPQSPRTPTSQPQNKDVPEPHLPKTQRKTHETGQANPSRPPTSSHPCGRDRPCARTWPETATPVGPQPQARATQHKGATSDSWAAQAQARPYHGTHTGMWTWAKGSWGCMGE